MNVFLRIASYLFHPLLMPLLGTFLYYFITPRFIEPEVIQLKLLAIVIITLLVPLVSFMLLKNLGLINSMYLEEVHERKAPLIIQCLLLLLILKMVFNPYDSIELYYFFVGILFSTISAFILTIFKFKISLHMMAVAGVTFFIVALSAHFGKNLIMMLSFLFIVNGWVASSRLEARAHTPAELIVGFFLGLVPQLVMLNFWL
ncbi:MAG: hypothetical protein ABJM06_09115 [Gilvibacter sp.]